MYVLKLPIQLFFSQLRPGAEFNERIDLIKYLKEIGYVLATGFIVGLPSETYEDIINNVLLAKYLSPDMHSFGPLIPASNTPLCNMPKVKKNLILKTIAIMRFIDSGSNILVTTALETLDKDAKKESLLAGANSMMINITPEKYRHLYAIYDNKAGLEEDVGKSVKETVELLYELGRAPTDIGDTTIKKLK